MYVWFCPRVYACVHVFGTFVYQTGSGKTYTMEGPSNADEHTQGMIPRALKQVFATAQDLSDKGWTVSFMYMCM